MEIKVKNYIFQLAGRPDTQFDVVGHLKKLNPPQTACHKFVYNYDDKLFYTPGGKKIDNKNTLLVQTLFLVYANSRINIEGEIVDLEY